MTTANLTSIPYGPLRSGDDGYDELCTSWNSKITHRPEIAISAATAEEVRHAVALAALRRLPVRVQATGHGAIEAADGGLLIVTSAMSEVTVDPGSGTALVQAGARWKDVIDAAYRHGLAPLSGSSSDVGAIGYSLGGGSGWLVRKHGLAADAIVAAQIVTADANVRWVDAQHEPELWWALRGGGPNLGVVTAVKMRLVPAARVWGGGLYWPIGQSRQILGAYRDWLDTVPSEMTSAITLLHLPPDPTIPKPLRGRSVIRIALCHAGPDLSGAEEIAAPLRAIPGLVIDTIGPLPYTSIDTISAEPQDPMPYSLWSAMLGELTDEVLQRLIGFATETAPTYTMIEVRHVGGGHRPADDRIGLAHWSGDFLAYAISVTPNQWAAAAAAAFARRIGKPCDRPRPGWCR